MTPCSFCWSRRLLFNLAHPPQTAVLNQSIGAHVFGEKEETATPSCMDDVVEVASGIYGGVAKEAYCYEDACIVRGRGGGERYTAVSSRRPTSLKRCSYSSSCSSRQLLPTPYVSSPVFEWCGALWQWRTVIVHPPLCRTETEERANTRLFSCLVPFLLCPYIGASSQLPCIDEQLHGKILQAAASERRENGGLESCVRREVMEEVSDVAGDGRDQWSARRLPRSAKILLPSPLGSVPIERLQQSTIATPFSCAESKATPPHAPVHRGGASNIPRSADAMSLMNAILHRVEQQYLLSGAGDPQAAGRGADPALRPVASITPAPSEGVYTHVFCTASAQKSVVASSHHGQGQRRIAHRNAEAAPVSQMTCIFPMERRNTIGGGLAPLLLAMDCYGALVQRRDLTMSAACWAALCDTKSAFVVKELRRRTVEIEREIRMSVAAHEALSRLARRRNKTSVGKSSTELNFDDFATLLRTRP